MHTCMRRRLMSAGGPTHVCARNAPRAHTCLAALTIPEAMTSQRMMPPKMLTRMALTCGSLVRILKAATTCRGSQGDMI
jgi:hypothetical protein